MKQSIETITPEIAKEILSKNSLNRTISAKRVALFAEDMKSGKWQLNGEAISIGKDGTLKDGQHRLTAIVLSNTAIITAVNRDVDNDVFLYDRGKSRTTTDILTVKGVDPKLCSGKNVAIIKLHYSLQKKNGTLVSDFDIENKLNEWKTTLLFLNTIRLPNKTINVKKASILLACLYAIECGVKKETIEKFLKVLASGSPENKSQWAATVLRNDLINKSIKTEGGRTERIRALYAVEKAIYDFNDGYERKKSYANCNLPVYSNKAAFKEE